MNRARRRTVLVIIAGILGLAVSGFVLSIALVSIQGMSGKEGLFELLLFNSLVFAIAFGSGGASLGFIATALSRQYERRFILWALLDFALGGGLGGAFLAVALKSIDYYEPSLRALTKGGPLGLFLLIAVGLSLLIALLMGVFLLARTISKKRG